MWETIVPLLNLVIPCLRKVLIHTYMTIVSYIQKRRIPLIAGLCSSCEVCCSPPVGQTVRSICVVAVFLEPGFV